MDDRHFGYITKLTPKNSIVCQHGRTWMTRVGHVGNDRVWDKNCWAMIGLDSDLGLWRTSVTGSMRTGLNSARPLCPSSPPRCKAPTQPLIKVCGNSCLDSALSVRPKFRRRRRRQRDLRTLHELLAEDLLVGFFSVHSFNALVLWKKGDLFLCVCALCTALCGWRAQTLIESK
jgi:hypothetical protein